MINKDSLYMSLAYLLAEGSKDDNTHVGAVVIGPDGDIKSTGWNGFPRGIDDSRLDRQVAPEKYFFFVHAEHNAILNAGRNGISLKECTLYCTAFPCHNCAQAIIQSGIRKVIYDKYLGNQWGDSNLRSKEMLQEANIYIQQFTSNFITPRRFTNGKEEKLD